MFLALHISPCKHSPWCLPLCSAHIFVTRVSKQGRPQKCWLLQAPIQHSQNWIELHLWFQLEMDQGLNLVIKQALCFWKALPWSGKVRVKGKRRQRCRSGIAQDPVGPAVLAEQVPNSNVHQHSPMELSCSQCRQANPFPPSPWLPSYSTYLPPC